MHLKLNRLDKWQLIQYKHQQFAKNFKEQYFQSLQTRFKWKTKDSNLAVGEMVLIYEENLPSSKWLLGRIVEVIESSWPKIDRLPKLEEDENVF